MKRAHEEEEDPLFDELIHLTENAENVRIEEASKMVAKYWRTSVYHQPESTRDLHPWITENLTKAATAGQKEWTFVALGCGGGIVRFVGCTAKTWDTFCSWHMEMRSLDQNDEFRHLSTPVYQKATQMLSDRIRAEMDRALQNICDEWTRAHPRIPAKLLPDLRCVRFFWGRE